MRFGGYILMAALVALSLSCSSDNNSISVVIPPELCVGFEPSEAPTPGDVTMRLRADSTCALAAVEVIGTDIDDLFSVAAHIEYNRTAVGFLQLETVGSALSQDGAQLFVRVEELLAGELTIGVSRNASDTVDIVGTQLLLTLYFVPFQLGTGDMTVETPCVTSGEQPPQPLGDVSCSGGSFAVEAAP